MSRPTPVTPIDAAPDAVVDRLSAMRVAVDDGLAKAASEGWSRRLWAGDASLWTGADEAKWLRWLAAGSGGAVDIASLEALGAKGTKELEDPDRVEVEVRDVAKKL